MKKFKVFIVLTALCCLLTVVLVACNGSDKGKGGDNGAGSGNDVGSGNISSGNVSDVNEIEQLRHIMSVVLDEFSTRLTTASAQLTADVQVGEKASFEKSSAVQQIFGYLDSVEDKEVIDSDNELNKISIKNFISVLAYGELLSDICDTDKIYGVPIEIEMGENISPSKGYVTIKSEGTHIIAYLYGKDDEVGELIYKYDIDYISDTEFSAKMITYSNDKFVYYVYGDTDGDSLLMTGDTLMYKAQNSDVCYKSTGATTVNSCFNKVNFELADFDFPFIRSLKDSCEKSSTHAQYTEIAEKLCEKYGVQ